MAGFLDSGWVVVRMNESPPESEGPLQKEKVSGSRKRSSHEWLLGGASRRRMHSPWAGDRDNQTTKEMQTKIRDQSLSLEIRIVNRGSCFF